MASNDISGRRSVGDAGASALQLTAVRIIAINRFYRPDHSATAQMLTDLAEACVRAGCEVEVLTSRLRYDGGADLPETEMLAGVRVRRIWTTAFGRAHLLGRAIDYATFYVCAFFALIWRLRCGDVLIAKTDPPLISIIAAAAARLRGARLVNWCQDLFPEAAAALGHGWAKGGAGRALRSLRDWSLRAADLNAALHARMAERLMALGAPNIVILPNWAPPEIRRDEGAARALRDAWNLPHGIVIGYSGNLGRAHAPERVADLLVRTRDIPELSWLFIGAGAGMDALRRVDADIEIRPYQPRAMLSASLGAPDAHLVSLDPECEGFIVPSKLYGVLAVGRPIVFLGARDGAVAREIASDPRSLTLDIDAPDTWKPALEAFVKRISSLDRSQPAPPYWSHRAINDWITALAAVAHRTSGAIEGQTSAPGAHTSVRSTDRS